MLLLLLPSKNIPAPPPRLYLKPCRSSVVSRRSASNCLQNYTIFPKPPKEKVEIFRLPPYLSRGPSPRYRVGSFLIIFIKQTAYFLVKVRVDFLFGIKQFVLLFSLSVSLFTRNLAFVRKKSISAESKEFIH